MIKILLTILTCTGYILSTNTVFGQEYTVDPGLISARFLWPAGKKMALTLSFDDARFSQVDNCLPILDKFGVKVPFTFYLKI